MTGYARLMDEMNGTLQRLTGLVRTKHKGLLLKLVIRDSLLKYENPVRSNAFHVQAAVRWLCKAQDMTGDGGVSAHFSLRHGWLPSYPETTGYIIPTMFDYYQCCGERDFYLRAIKMADFILSIQNHDGSIYGGEVGFSRGKTVFDTGQILFGLTRAFRETGDERYRAAAMKAGEWLISVQEDDGAWRQYEYGGMAHVYNTRVAWGLLQLHDITGDGRYLRSARQNIDWALSKQAANYWFSENAFTPFDSPFTHTIAYALEGILESGVYLGEDAYIKATLDSAQTLLRCLASGDFFKGTYDSQWNSRAHYSCLTGNAQISIIFLRCYQLTQMAGYRDAAKRLNEFLKKKQWVDGNKNIYGAIAGSCPIHGEYMPFSFPNWAAKFFIDAILLEGKVGMK